MQPYNQRRPAKSGNGAAFHVAIVWAVTCPMGLFGLGGLSHTHTFATTNQIPPAFYFTQCGYSFVSCSRQFIKQVNKYAVSG